MLLFDIEKVCRTKILTKKYFFVSFNNDRGLSLDDKTKDYAGRNTGGQVNSLHEVTQLKLYSGLKFAYLSGRTKKLISQKLKYIFAKKTTPQLLGQIGLQNMKVGEKTNLGDLPLFV